MRFGKFSFRIASEVTDGLVGFLLGHGVSLPEELPAVCGDLGEVEVRLRGFEVRPSLLQLLVDFGRLNLSGSVPRPTQLKSERVTLRR